MADSSEGLRQCPTRTDGRPVLLAHSVTRFICQNRQREHYHKCFACSLSNALVGNERQEAVLKKAGEFGREPVSG